MPSEEAPRTKEKQRQALSKAEANEDTAAAGSPAK